MHRDVKLQNILVSDETENAEVFIADFGIAVQLDYADSLVQANIGTSGYIAPEVLLDIPYSF